MKRKAKTGPDSKPTAASIARLAGCSISLVYRKLLEGKTPAEIVAGSQRRKEELAMRGLPTLPVTHANGTVLSFSVAQSMKETWSARLKQLEYGERSGELIPVSYVRHWGTNLLVATKDEMLRGPSELADRLASESDPHIVAEVLGRWAERVMAKLHQLDRVWGVESKDDVA